MLRVGVYLPHHLPHSFRVYANSIMREAAKLGVEFEPFAYDEALPGNVHLYWDPRSGGGGVPYRALNTTPRPVVVTVHGAAPMALPSREYFSNHRERLLAKVENARKRRGWQRFLARPATIITVSNFAKNEIHRCLGIPLSMIEVIHHGVDHEIFRPLHNTPSAGKPYLLHISQYQPKKNFDRILAAYAALDVKRKPLLRAVVPGYRGRAAPEGVEITTQSLEHETLVRLYQCALGFVFPSLHESFGLPVLEAMACGCPVVTTNGTACPEVAGDAALLVDPRSVADLTDALKGLISRPDLRQELRALGISRAKTFSWQTSALGHVEAFKKVSTNNGSGATERSSLASSRDVITE